MGKGNLSQTISATKIQRLTKKKQVLTNPDVKRWYDNLARGSKVTAEVRLRRMRLFCEEHNMTPMELIQLGLKDSKAVTDLLQDHITMMEEKNKAPQYIKSTMTSVKSWLRHFDIEIKRRLKISNPTATPTLQNEKVPEPEELSELFNRASLRAGATMALIGKAGLRPEVIGNFDATDGLTIKDMPDLAVVKGLATFIRTPPMTVVRQNLSKASHEYFTFITDLGSKKVLAYLNERILSGESLGPDSPVIAPYSKFPIFRGSNQKKKFLTSERVEDVVRDAMRPRFKWRPYVLRAFFDTGLLIAESRGRIAFDTRSFVMGHTGSIESVYSTKKGILPKRLLDEMRESFKRSEEFLDLERSEDNPLEKQKEQLKENIEKLPAEQLAEVQKLISSF